MCLILFDVPNASLPKDYSTGMPTQTMQLHSERGIPSSSVLPIDVSQNCKAHSKEKEEPMQRDIAHAL